MIAGKARVRGVMTGQSGAAAETVMARGRTSMTHGGGCGNRIRMVMTDWIASRLASVIYGNRTGAT